jgi:hypothetical protein
MAWRGSAALGGRRGEQVLLLADLGIELVIDIAPDVVAAAVLDVAAAVVVVIAAVIAAVIAFWRVAIAGAQAAAHLGLDAGHAVEDALGPCTRRRRYRSAPPDARVSRGIQVKTRVHGVSRAGGCARTEPR